jgi:hypothetical protein
LQAQGELRALSFDVMNSNGGLQIHPKVAAKFRILLESLKKLVSNNTEVSECECFSMEHLWSYALRNGHWLCLHMTL